MRRPLLAVAAALVLGVSLAAGPAEAGDDPSMSGAPAVGSCFDLTEADGAAYSVAKDPVDCAVDHTTKVVAVKVLPGSLTWDSTDEAIGTFVSKTCNAAFNAAVGGNAVSQFRTQYTWFWFAPSRSQRDAGARWFSCHVAVDGDGGLADVADPLERIDSHVSDAIARCTVGRGPYFGTTCAERHDWRMTWSGLVNATSTKSGIAAAADRYCPRRVTTRHWLYSWRILGKRQFILGCSSFTRR